MKVWRLSALIAFWLVSVTTLAGSQQSHDAFEDWASKRFIRVRTDDIDTTVSDLLPLRGVVGQARLVAYGEPTHGAHEPLAFRNRLFRFLVERMGFTAIAVESGLTESEAVNRYVTGGPGNLSDVVRNGISWGFGEFGENEELVAWMRSYNENPTHPRKVRFYGIDLSGSGNGAFPNARHAVDAALGSLRLRDAPVANSLDALLSPLLGRFSSDGYASLSSADRKQLATTLKKLGNALSDKGTRLHSPNTDATYSWSVQNARVAEQLRQMLEVYPPPSASPGIPPEAFRAEAVREAGMAENVQWALQLEAPAGRVLVFAHNNHVMNSTITGGAWSAFRVPPPAMGKFLRSALGDKLVIAGSASRVVEARNRVDSTSLDLALSQLSRSSFILDLRPARARPEILRWLSRSRPLHANGGDYVIVKPIGAFDAIVFVDTLTGARRSSSLIR